jgi:hypothetical protein
MAPPGTRPSWSLGALAVRVVLNGPGSEEGGLVGTRVWGVGVGSEARAYRTAGIDGIDVGGICWS